MNNNRIAGKINMFLKIIIITLSMILSVLLIVLIYEFFEEMQYLYKDEDNFYFWIEASEYDYLLSDYIQNISNGYEDKEELQEYHAVAKYYQAATLYKAYYLYEEYELAEKFYEEMENIENEMGSLKDLKKDIYIQLGLDNLKTNENVE